MNYKKTNFRFLNKKVIVIVKILFIFIILTSLSFSNIQTTQAATYTWTQTNWNTQTSNAAQHSITNLEPAINWTEYLSKDSGVTAGANLQLGVSTTTFSETFTSTTYKNSTSTNATWNISSGQLEMATEQNGTYLYSALHGILGGLGINAQVKVGNDIYFGADGGKFLKYNIVSDTATDLTANISSAFSTYAINSMAFDSTNNMLYLGGSASKFAKYNIITDTATNLSTKISSFWSGTNYPVNSVIFDSANNVVYLGGGYITNTRFARYQTTSWAGSGTCTATGSAYTADTACNLSAKISSGMLISSFAFDSAHNVLYIGQSYNGSMGFARYQTSSWSGSGTCTATGSAYTADTACNLTAKITAVWGNNYALKTLVFDSANNVVYLGGGYMSSNISRFARYQTDSWSDSGTCSADSQPYTADAACNLTSKLSTWGASNKVNSLTLDAVENVIYLGGSSGGVMRYQISSWNGSGTCTATGSAYTADAICDLTAKISSFWGTSIINSVILDSVNSVVYIGGDSGKFAKYTIGIDAGSNLTSKVNGVSWNEIIMYSMVRGDGNNIYLGGSSGKFVKYDTQTGVATLIDLTPATWTATIYALGYDSVNGDIYLGGSGGKFAKYNIASGTVSSAISLAGASWSTSDIRSLLFDGSTGIYLGGSGGKFAKYTIGGSATIISLAGASWSTTIINSIIFDGSTGIYLAGDIGKFAKYTIGGSVVSLDLSGASWDATYNINDLAFDYVNRVVYLIGNLSTTGKLARYNTQDAVVSATYPNINTAYSLNAKTPVATNGMKIILDSINNLVYMAGGQGAITMTKYEISADSGVSLTSYVSFMPSIASTLAIGNNNRLYIGGYFGGFAEKLILPVSASAVSLTVDSMADNIYYSTLTKNDTVGTGSITYWLSNNGGTNWESVTPSVLHTFSTVGSDLRFKIIVSGNATVQDMTINYSSYPSSQTLTSSAYYSGAGANVMGGLAWNEDASLPTGTTVTVSLRTASTQGGLTGAWTDFTNATANCSKVSTTVTCAQSAIPAGMKDGSGDRYYQYKVTLTSTGDNTPTVSDVFVSYGSNAAPAFDVTYGTNGILISQISSPSDLNYGKVQIGYSIKDSDTDSGSVTRNYVTPTFEYSTDGGSNWSAIAPSSIIALTPVDETHIYGTYNGSTTVKVVYGTFTTYEAIWTPPTGVSVSNAQIRITLNDNESFNNTTVSTSGNFALDTLVPTATVGADSFTNKITVNISDTNNVSYIVSNNSDLTADGVNNTSGQWISVGANSVSTPIDWIFSTSSSSTVYLQAKDIYGNISTIDSSDIFIAPTNFSYKDISIPANNEYRELLYWAQYNPAQPISFLRYELYRSETSSTTGFALIASIIPVSNTVHSDSLSSATSTYYYKLRVVDNSGDASFFTNVISDIPNGGGGTDIVPPVISAVTVVDTDTSWATISWTTDKDSNSVIEYSTSTDAYNLSASNNTLGINHQITLTNLLPNTIYYYRVKSTDASQNLATQSLNSLTSQQLQFITENGPLVSGIGISALTDASVTVNWITDKDSTSRVVYSQATTFNGSYEVGSDSMTGQSASSTSFTHSVDITGLQPGTTYYYYVKSSDGTITTIDNNSGSYYNFTTNSANPPAISNISVPVKTSQSAVIFWQTDKLATSQVVYGLTDTVLNQSSAYDSNFTTYHAVFINGLTPQTDYYFQVKSASIFSSNSIITSTTTSFVTPSTGISLVTISGSNGVGTNSTTPDTAPPLITNITASSTNAFTATVSFDTSESTIGFLQYGKDSTYGNTLADKNYSTHHTFNLTGLKMGTEYHYQVQAMDKASNSTSDVDKTFKTNYFAENLESLATLENAAQFEQEIENSIQSILPSLLPPTISNPEITEINQKSVVVSWKTNVRSYSVVAYAPDNEYNKNSEKPYTSEASDVVNKVTDHSITLIGLEPDTQYHFIVKSFSLPQVVGSSKDVAFNTKSSPVQARAYDIKNDSFRVSWATTEPASSIVESRNAKGEVIRKTDEVKNTTHDMIVDRLTPGTKYEVRVSGYNSRGNLIEAGEVLTIVTSVDVTAPTISGFKVDSALVPGRNDKLQSIISWTTNEPATSVVYYQEGAGSSEKEFANKVEVTDSYVLNHAVILSSFKPGTIYQIKVVSKDLAGNSASFGPRTIITPRQNESIFDVIFKNFEDTFKFLRNAGE